MINTVANFKTARKRRTNQRVFQALECMYVQALQHLADREGNIDPADWEAFMIQVLGEYLTHVPDQQTSQPTATPQVLANYQRFDNGLRHCLHQKIRSLHHFERLRVRT